MDIFEASKTGNLARVQELIASDGEVVNALDNTGDTALIYASLNGHLPVVKELITHSANVNARDNDGNTALIYASAYGQLPVVSKLIEHGALVNEQNNNGKTALTVTSENGHLAVVIKLLQHGADVNARDNDGNTALIFASLKGHSAVVIKLIELGANINAQNNHGRTALMRACTIDRLAVVTELIERGADVNVRDGFGLTAIDQTDNQQIRDLLRIPKSLPVTINECIICMENKNLNINFDHPNRIQVLPCGHTFHKKCIAPVMPKICPTCRTPFVNPSNLMLGGYYNKYQKYINKLKF